MPTNFSCILRAHQVANVTKNSKKNVHILRIVQKFICTYLMKYNERVHSIFFRHKGINSKHEELSTYLSSIIFLCSKETSIRNTHENISAV